jgi:hypothetical protein
MHIAPMIIAPTRTVQRPDKNTGEGDARDFDVAYSELNIVEWMKYLPPDCIQSMIRMGWDSST